MEALLARTQQDSTYPAQALASSHILVERHLDLSMLLWLVEGTMTVCLVFSGLRLVLTALPCICRGWDIVGRHR